MLEHPVSLRVTEDQNAPLGKKQKRFNTLVDQVARLRHALQDWANVAGEISRGAAEHDRLLAESHRLRRELVLLFDDKLADRALSRIDRRDLGEILCGLAYELLTEHPDDEIKAIYNRHARSDFDREAAAEDAARARALQQSLEDDFGVVIEGTFDSIEDLEQATRARFEAAEAERAARAAETEQRRSRRKKSARQVAAEARREAEQTQVGKALQEIYRKLAIALHPDREPDPAERARKTELMQAINVAYERRDLLRLLELQLRFEQIDELAIGSLAEDKLERFNRLLAEQVAQLRDELAAIEYPYRVQLDVPPPRKLPPARVLASLRDDLRALAEDVANVRADLVALANTAALRAWLRKERETARMYAMVEALMDGPSRRRR